MINRAHIRVKTFKTFHYFGIFWNYWECPLDTPLAPKYPTKSFQESQNAIKFGLYCHLLATNQASVFNPLIESVFKFLSLKKIYLHFLKVKSFKRFISHSRKSWIMYNFSCVVSPQYLSPFYFLMFYSLLPNKRPFDFAKIIRWIVCIL